MKNNIKKTILTLIAIITLMSTVAVLPTYAALPDTGGTVEPMWDNTATIHLTIHFSDNGYGYAEGSIIGKVGVTKIIVDVQVSKQSGSSWIQVASKQIIINGQNGVFSCQFSPTTGAYYKVDYTFTVTKGTVNEVISKTKYATCD